jgi:7-cyano-7-deazaguanine synthase in queuosine biosynthesis
MKNHHTATGHSPVAHVRASCDGQVVIRTQHSDKTTTCQLDIRYDDLEKFCWKRLSSVQFDLTFVTQVVAYTDRAIKRWRQTNWMRNLELEIAVHDPDLWNSHAVVSSLEDSLSFLTGDRWSFHFTQREREEEWLFKQKFLDIQPPEKPIKVLPFSGGMDSWAVALTEAASDPDSTFLLLQVKGPSALALFNAGSPLKNLRQLQIPFRLRGLTSKEETYRTRSFIFYSIAALAAALADEKEVLVTENGQGSIGPSLIPYGGEWPLRGSHPGFTTRLTLFLKSILGQEIQFCHKALWQTKGQTLKKVSEHNFHTGWHQTQSCTRPLRTLPIPNVQCGVCSNCLLRRVSVNTAGLDATQESYVWNNLNGPTLDEMLSNEAIRSTSRTDARYAELAVKDFAKLAKTDSDSLLNELAIHELATAISETEEATVIRVKGLISAHAGEWNQFVGKLDEASWLRKWSETWYEQY